MANIDLWGVTESGFYRPTIDDIINEKNKKAKEVFGDDFDTHEQTPQGKFFRINAAAESKLCEIAEQVYYSFTPVSATGISLDRVCSGVNLTRDSASYASHKIRVYGTQDYVIPAGTLFKNVAGIEFYTSADATISTVENDEYYAEVTVYCTESGTIGNVENINATVEVNTDIQRVVYVSEVAYGTEVESDPSLRERYNVVVQGLGTNTEAAIKANVMRVNGVNDVIIINNRTSADIEVSDSLTVEAGTYAVIVHSDDISLNSDIATAIFEKQPLGIPQCGVQSVTIVDDAGIEQEVKFTYVEAKTINVVVACNVTSDFPSTGLDQIKSRISDYIDQLGIGDEVVYSQLYNYIYDVAGVYKITNMTLNGKTEDIPTSKIQIAKVGSVTVSLTEI